MTDIVADVEEHTRQLIDHGRRIDGHDLVLYGDDRTRSDGLIVASQKFQIQIEQKIDRLVWLTYALVLAIAILAITVAMAVFA